LFDRDKPPAFELNHPKIEMRRTPNLKTLCLISLLSLALGKVQAQQARNYAIHANIIYRFTKYIDWPEDKKTGDFIIGIVGDSPLYEELRNFTAGKLVGNHKIVIKRITSTATYDSCHILFICEDESGSLKKIAALTAGAPVLILSESEGLAHKGSCINFIILDEHLKLEINKNNISLRNLGIASELLSLGIIVK
jgi:hypothetical protein